MRDVNLAWEFDVDSTLYKVEDILYDEMAMTRTGYKSGILLPPRLH